MVIPPLNERRLNVVEEAYHKIDPSGRGSVSLDQLYNNYDSKNHPDVKCGKIPEEEAIAKFLDVFDASTRGPQGVVGKQEFIEAYREIAASYPMNDEGFVKMMEAVWGVEEPRGASGKTITDLEALIKDKIRLRLQGNETEEQALIKVFKFVDLDENGHLTPGEFQKALARIGVNLSEEEVNTFIEKFDLDRSGTIDYSEFCKAVGSYEGHFFTKSVTHSLFTK